jgi:hypothetical protein
MENKESEGEEVERKGDSKKRSSVPKEIELQLWGLECFFFTFGEKKKDVMRSPHFALHQLLILKMSKTFIILELKSIKFFPC